MSHTAGDGTLQRVVKAQVRPHTSFMMNPVVKTHFWSLELACGHIVERRIRWLPLPPGTYHPRGYAAMHHSPSLARLPEEPKRARCTPEVWG